MLIPDDAVIPPEKVTAYLLVPRPWDDKSKFLAGAGFTRENPEVLLAAPSRLAIGVDGQEDGTNEYGTFYRVEGQLVGPDGRTLDVVTIWLRWRIDDTFHFVTLKPRRTRS